MKKRCKKLSALLLALVMTVASTVFIPSVKTAAEGFAETETASITPDTPGLNEAMIRDDMVEKYGLLFEKTSSSAVDVSYEALPVTNDRFLKSSPEIDAKAAEVTAGLTTDREKAYALYDWIANNIYYDYDNFYDGANYPTFRDARGAFTNRRTVCEGFANLYAVMCRAVGLPCRMAVGFTITGDVTLQEIIDVYFGPESSKGLHAWNEVYFDGAWHFIDVTWDTLNQYIAGNFYPRENHNFNYFDSSLAYFGRSHLAIKYNTYLRANDFLITVINGRLNAQLFNGTSSVAVLPEIVESVSSNVFMETPQVTELVLPKTTDSIAFSPLYCNTLEKVTLSEGVKKVPDGIFDGCTALSEILLPSSIEEIGEKAFRGCTSLKTVSGSENVKKIGRGAFENCAELINFKTADNLKEIGEYAFYYCPKLEKIQLGSGLTELPSGAFMLCFGLKEISLPKALITVGDGAFSDCKLETVRFEGSEADWKKVSVGQNNGALTSAEFIYNSSSSSVLIGDVDGDGKVSLNDGMYIVCDVAKVTPMTEAFRARADIDADGKLSLKDVMYILMYVSGKADSVKPKN